MEPAVLVAFTWLLGILVATWDRPGHGPLTGAIALGPVAALGYLVTQDRTLTNEAAASSLLVPYAILALIGAALETLIGWIVREQLKRG